MFFTILPNHLLRFFGLGFLCFVLAFLINVHLHSQPTLLIPVGSPTPDEPLRQQSKANHTQTPWYLAMQQPNANVPEVERLFNEYFIAHPFERSKQKQQCQLWIEQGKLNMDANGLPLPHPAWTENDVRAFIIRNSKPISGNRDDYSPYPEWNDVAGTWRMIGPYHAQPTRCTTSPNPSSYMMGGFCDRVYINPFNTNNLYAGLSYGGLWVSQDKGQTWALTDAQFPNGTNTYANRDYYYGKIEASPANPALVYAATETGVLKSTNFGQTWSLCPTVNRTVDATKRPWFITLAPDDTLTALCNFGKFIYRTTDAGQTWSVVFNNNSGGPNHTFTSQHSVNTNYGVYERTYNFWGLAFHPTNPNVVLLGVYNSANQACIYKSTNKGATFSLLVNVSQNLSRTMPSSLFFEVKPVSPDKIFVFSLFTQDTLYKYSSTNGALLDKYRVGAELEAFDITHNNENILYAGYYGSGEVKKSVNGGQNFTIMNPGYTSCPNYVHPDVRCIHAIGNMVLIATDGGVTLSEDAMATTRSIGNHISAIDLWGFSSSFKSDIVAAGCDHGPTKFRRFDGEFGWLEVGGGDASDVTVNPVNDRWFYHNNGYNKYKRYINDNGATSSFGVVENISFHRIEFHPNVWTTAYGISGAKILRSTDNLSTATEFYDFGETVNRIKIALKNPMIMYALLSNNKIRKSTDGGITWTLITPPSSVSGGQTNIRDIDVGNNPDELYAAYGNYQTTCKIVRTTNGGTTWTNLTANLPTAAAYQIAFQRGTNGGIYIALVGRGVYYRNNSMTQWEPLGTGLPMAGYWQNLYTVPARNKFRMGSSRGAWEHNLYEPSAVHALISTDKTTTACARDSIAFRDYSAYYGNVTFNWAFEGGSPATSTLENPKVSYNTPGAYSVTLTVTDAQGNSDTQTLTNFVTVLPSVCAPDATPGTALQLNGSSQYATAPALNLNSNTVTLTAWIKRNGAQNDWAGILFCRSGNTTAGISIRNTNELRYHWNDGGYGWASGLTVPDNEWTHIALVASPTSMRIYRNGVPATHTTTINPEEFNAALNIGYDANNSARYFNGLIDEVCVYNRTLTQAEIRELMHLTKQPDADPTLVAYYQFNNTTTGATEYDRARVNHATLVGGATRVPSTGPFAGGNSFRTTVNAAGLIDAPPVGLRLNFAGGTLPGGEIVLSRLNYPPNDLPPCSNFLANNGYYILNNYGANATFTAPATAELYGINVPPLANLPATAYSLYKRNFNAEGNSWGSPLATPTTITEGISGSFSLGNTNGFTSQGQFALTANLTQQSINGSSEACVNGISAYSVAPLNTLGATYTWSITAGSGAILSGQGTPQIQVQWLNNQPGQVSVTITE